MNQIMIEGNLGSDPEIKMLKDEVLASFSLAHTPRKKINGQYEDGETIYRFDMDVLEEVMPELYQVMQDDMDQVLIDLYLKGLIEVSYDENLNAQMTISEDGKRALQAEGFDMNDFDETDF